MRKSKKNVSKNYNRRLRKLKAQDQGVTMVALVVTIIILLILSGITIRFIVGEDGIIGQAKEASLKYQNSTLQEQLLLNSLDEQIAEISKGSSNGSGSDANNGSSDGNGTSDGNSNNGNSDNQATIDELNQKIDNLQRQVTALTEKVAEAEDERDSNLNKVTELEAQLNQSLSDNSTLQEKIQELQNTVNTLQATITKLQSTISDCQNKINDYQETIEELRNQKSTGTAIASEVLEGRTFSNSSGTGLVGTMINNGSLTVTLTPSGNNTATKTFAAGYYSGGTITADGTAAYNAGYTAGQEAVTFSSINHFATRVDCSIGTTIPYNCVALIIFRPRSSYPIYIDGVDVTSECMNLDISSTYAGEGELTNCALIYVNPPGGVFINVGNPTDGRYYDVFGLMK